VSTAIVYVLTTDCAWLHLPAEFGVSKATAHRRSVAWTAAGARPWRRAPTALAYFRNDFSTMAPLTVPSSQHLRHAAEARGGGSSGTPHLPMRPRLEAGR
jgi:transposase